MPTLGLDLVEEILELKRTRNTSLVTLGNMVDNNLPVDCEEHLGE